MNTASHDDNRRWSDHDERRPDVSSCDGRPWFNFGIGLAGTIFLLVVIAVGIA